MNGLGVVLFFCFPLYRFVVLYSSSFVVFGNLNVIEFYTEIIQKELFIVST